MIRDTLLRKGVGASAQFRWRGDEISRVEGFSDAVFAFSITLLIVSLEVPRTFDQLMVTMRGFLPFAVSFMLLISVWYDHYVFFRRYGLQDAHTISLNSALLFVVLFYVYPLKFLFTVTFDAFVTGGEGRNAIENSQLPALMAIFSAGFTAVFLLFGLMFLHAYRKRDELDLNELERFDTRESIVASFIKAGCGGASVAIALIGGEGFGGLAGMIYPIVFAPSLTIFHSVMGRKRRRMELALQAGTS